MESVWRRTIIIAGVIALCLTAAPVACLFVACGLDSGNCP